MGSVLKKAMIVLILAFVVMIFGQNKNIEAKTTKTYNYTILQNAYYEYLEDAGVKNNEGKVKKIIISNKKKLSIVECPPTYFYNYDPGLYIYGKKPGKVTVTVKTKKENFVYNIKILSSKKVNKKAKRKLKKVAKGLKNTKKCAYADFTGDSIKDLFVDGKLYAYDINVGLKKIDFGGQGEGKMKKVINIYISKKNQLVYFGFKYSKKNRGGDMYEKGLVALAYDMKNIREHLTVDYIDKVVEESRYIGIIRNPKKFVPKKKYKKNENYYIIDYPWDDQDDAWYDYYTSRSLKKAKKRMLKNKKVLKITKKPNFKN